MGDNGIEVLYEDNHIIIVNKSVSDLVQKDKTGDLSLDDKIRIYLKERYHKSGNVFVGVPHRLDRPVSGAVIYTKTSKALSRMCVMFNEKEIQKTYWAIVSNKPPENSGSLKHFLVRNTNKNRSFAYDFPQKDSKEAQLLYKLIASSEKYHLLEIDLITGRHHQIRCQLAKIGCPIKGDLKYGFPRSNPDGGISLHARMIRFIHPVNNDAIVIVAPLPKDNLWKAFQTILKIDK